MATDDTRVSDMTPNRDGSTGGNLGERYGGAGEGAGGVNDTHEAQNENYDAVSTSRDMSGGQSSGTDYSYSQGGQADTTSNTGSRGSDNSGDNQGQ